MNSEVPENNKSNPNPYSKINTFYLGGFKAFKGMETISIRPITLVFGQNSAGKSSLIKGLLYALDGEMSSQGDFTTWNDPNQEPDYLEWKRLLNNDSQKIEYAFSFNEKVSKFNNFDYMLDDSIDLASKNPEHYDVYNAGYIYNSNSDEFRLNPDFKFSNQEKGGNQFEIDFQDGRIKSIKSYLLNGLLNKVKECYESAGVNEGEKYVEHLREEIHSVSIQFGHDKFDEEKNGRFRFLKFSENTEFATRDNSYGGPDPAGEIIKAMNQRLFELWNGLDSGDHHVINDILACDIQGQFCYFTHQACGDIIKYVKNGKFNPLHQSVATRKVALCILSDVLFYAKMRSQTVGLAKMLYIDSSRSFMNNHTVSSNENIRTWRNFLEAPVTLAAVNDWLKNKLQTNFQIKKSIRLKSRNDLENLVSGKLKIEDVELGDNEGLRIEDVRVKDRLLHVQDVGYGLQKLIPVLAAGSAVKNDKSNITQNIDIIAIEEPEMHLHPKLQSDLGDLFVDSVINNSEKTFILETHSEHLLLRILKRIREGDISKDAISILYVHPGQNGSGAIVEKLELDDEGDFLLPWPPGFFDVRHKNLF